MKTFSSSLFASDEAEVDGIPRRARDLLPAEHDGVHEEVDHELRVRLAALAADLHELLLRRVDEGLELLVRALQHLDVHGPRRRRRMNYSFWK